MRKIDEMTTEELTNLMFELAGPVGNLVQDDDFWTALQETTKAGMKLRQKDTLRFILTAYARLTPILFGKYRGDTIKIISIIENRPVSEVSNANGMEVLRNLILEYWEKLRPFFTTSAPTGEQG